MSLVKVADVKNNPPYLTGERAENNEGESVVLENLPSHIQVLHVTI